MPNRVGVAKHRLHPDLPSRANLDGANRYIVCPKVKGAAARQFEPRVMPVAGQDAVLDAATLQRETHMGTAVVEREDVPVLVHEQNRAVAAVHNKPTLGFQLFKTARVYEIRRRAIHERLIREVSASVPFGKDIPRMSIRSTDIAKNLAGEGAMLSPQTDRITSRRLFLRFLVASPLFTPIGSPAFAQNTSAPPRLPDPMVWAPRDLDKLISDPKEALDVFDFEPVAKKNVPRRTSVTWSPASTTR
jgi:hypothetical protein